jgi:hypothetical protein
MPPPADAEVSVAQLTELVVPDVVLDEELDEQPVASKVKAATPARANLYGDLTSASLKASPKRTSAARPFPGGPEGGLPTHLAPS